MLTAPLIQKLKQNNISADVEKTKKHMSQVWKAASRQDQDKILALAGVARSTVHRVYRKGGISAKLAMAMAQTLDINPFYLTGAADEPGSCTNELIAVFLSAHKYDALLTEWNKVERRQRQSVQPAAVKPQVLPAAEPAPEVAAALMETVAAEAVPVEAAPSQAALDMLTEEDLIVLVRSLFIRAKADPRGAELVLQLKKFLLA